MTPDQRRLAGQLCAFWAAEVEVQRILTSLAESVKGKHKSRLLVFSACASAHAQRLLGRLSALEVKQLPVLTCDETLGVSVAKGLLSNLAKKYVKSAEIARQVNDPATAWVLELNGVECRDFYDEVCKIAEKLPSTKTPAVA